MPVIINEFEVVSEAAPSAAGGAPDAASERPKPKLEAAALQAPLETLHQEALRVWVH